MDNETFMKTIMNRFNCDKKMAETIYKASEKSGELDKIKFMSGYDERSNKE